MVTCSACGKPISGKDRDLGIRERDQSYHIACAPDDLLDDAVSEWNAILDRGVVYFVRKYSVPGGPKSRNRAARVDSFADLGKRIIAESKRRSR